MKPIWRKTGYDYNNIMAAQQQYSTIDIMLLTNLCVGNMHDAHTQYCTR